MQPFRPDPDEERSITDLVDRWADRVEVFRKLAGRAHPSGDAPAWLNAAVDEMGRDVEQLRALDERLHDRVTLASFQEEEVRSVRLRIGRALDQLAADESRVSRARAAAEAQSAEARARLEQIAEPLLAAWRALPVAGEDAALTPVVVGALREAGVLASIRVDAARTLYEAETELTGLAREQSDLQFQIEQLKGRLGLESAGAEHDLDGLRDETHSLDRALQDRLDAVVRGAEPVVRHYMQFPHLRDVVRSVH